MVRPRGATGSVPRGVPRRWALQNYLLNRAVIYEPRREIVREDYAAQLQPNFGLGFMQLPLHHRTWPRSCTHLYNRFAIRSEGRRGPNRERFPLRDSSLPLFFSPSPLFFLVGHLRRDEFGPREVSIVDRSPIRNVTLVVHRLFRGLTNASPRIAFLVNVGDVYVTNQFTTLVRSGSLTSP